MREAEPLLRGQGTYVSDLRFPGMLHAAVLRSPHAHARIGAVDASGALAMSGVVRVLTGEDIRDAIEPFPSSFEYHPAPWLQAIKPVLKGPRARVLALGRGALRRRAGGHGRGRGPLPGRGRARRHRRGLRGASAGGGPRGGAGTGRRADPRGCGRQRRVPLQHRQGRRGTGLGERSTPHRGTPAPPAPRRHPHGGKRRRGHGRGQAAPPDRVVVHPGPPQRTPADRRPARHDGGDHPGGGAPRGRRVRAQGGGLSRGSAGALPRPGAGAAGAVDRGPPGALHQHGPRPGPDPLRGAWVRRRRPDTGPEGPLPAGQRRLQPHGPHRRLQHLGPPAGTVPGAQPGRHRLLRGHQQGAQRPLPRRRTSGGGVRDGALHRPHRRRAGPRPGRGALPQLRAARGDPLRRRRPLSGRHAGALRQRRLPRHSDKGPGRVRLPRRARAAEASRVPAGVGGRGGTPA